MDKDEDVNVKIAKLGAAQFVLSMGTGASCDTELRKLAIEYLKQSLQIKPQA